MLLLVLFSRGRRVRSKRSEAAGASKLELGWQVVVVDSLVDEVRRSQILRFSLSKRSQVKGWIVWLADPRIV